MKNDKKTITIFLVQIVFLLSIFVIIPLGLYMAGKYYTTDKTIYEQNWGIVLPDGLKEIYSETSPPSFHGDGVRFTVFSEKKTDEKFIATFHNKKDEDIEKFVEEILDELNVNEEDRPDLDKAYRWKKYREFQNDTLIIIYIKDVEKYYFFQYTT